MTNKRGKNMSKKQEENKKGCRESTTFIAGRRENLRF
jgi:hypothetical protein